MYAVKIMTANRVSGWFSPVRGLGWNSSLIYITSSLCVLRSASTASVNRVFLVHEIMKLKIVCPRACVLIALASLISTELSESPTATVQPSSATVRRGNSHWTREALSRKMEWQRDGSLKIGRDILHAIYSSMLNKHRLDVEDVSCTISLSSNNNWQNNVSTTPVVCAAQAIVFNKVYLISFVYYTAIWIPMLGWGGG